MPTMRRNKQYLSDSGAEWTSDTVKKEVDQGLDLVNSIEQPILTFFGSHRVDQENSYYKQAYSVALELGEMGHAIISGGGPGIMHAVNSGATKAGTESVGLKAALLTGEEVNDKIYTKQMAFHFMFVRRFVMSIKSEALIFFPGGYGTLNELFEYAVLMQTGITDTVPIICVGVLFGTVYSIG